MTSKSCPGFTNSENSPITFIVLASIFTAPISTISDGSSDLYGLKFLSISNTIKCVAFSNLFTSFYIPFHTHTFIFSIYLFIHFMHVILRLKTKIQSHYAMYIGGYSIKCKKKGKPFFLPQLLLVNVCSLRSTVTLFYFESNFLTFF